MKKKKSCCIDFYSEKMAMQPVSEGRKCQNRLPAGSLWSHTMSGSIQHRGQSRGDG